MVTSTEKSGASKAAALVERRAAVVAKGVGQFAGAATAGRASGARLVGMDGAEWIDFAGGIGVMNVGRLCRARSPCSSACLRT